MMVMAYVEVVDVVEIVMPVVLVLMVGGSGTFGMVKKTGTWGELGNLKLWPCGTLALCRIKSSPPSQSERANGKEISTAATHSYNVCSQVSLHREGCFM